MFFSFLHHQRALTKINLNTTYNYKAQIVHVRRS